MHATTERLTEENIGKQTKPGPAMQRLWILMSVIGPGIIAANADNDAGGIFGYSVAGAYFHYRMIWILIVTTIALAVCQEIGARMAAVTGKGLADLIREEYGVKITFVAMVALLVANFATTVSEFAGVLSAVQTFAPSWVRFIVLPALAVAVWFLIARGSYKRLERILLGASVIYLLYIVSAFMAKPNWAQVFHETVHPAVGAGISVNTYVFMIINVVGTTITPWGQFYIQSTVRDKGVGIKDYGLLRADVLFGSFFTNFIAFFIVVCCGATLYNHGYAGGINQLDDAGKAAQALGPFAGNWASILFAIGLFNASCFGAITVPLSTAYSVTEALGWESGMGRRVREAPLFVGVFTALIVLAALTVMLFPKNLTSLMILPNIVGGVLLPIILVLMLRLVNKRRLMGKYTNSLGANIIAWLTTCILIGLSLTLLITTIFPSIGK